VVVEGPQHRNEPLQPQVRRDKTNLGFFAEIVTNTGKEADFDLGKKIKESNPTFLLKKEAQR
jgi:hypothetical protein